MGNLRTERDEECYWRREMPTSPGRLLLVQALARLCAARHGHDLQRVALTFDEEGSIFVDEPARSQVFDAARRLGEAFAAGEVRTYCREFGGSVPQLLPPSSWELDDFDPRFATSAINPAKPFDAGSAATHWIFVDEVGLDGLVRSGTAAAGRLAAGRLHDASGHLTVDAPAGDGVATATGPDRHVRMPELEARTGMSRATIYRRIAAARFPKPIPMDGNIAAWRDRDVIEWLANPR